MAACPTSTTVMARPNSGMAEHFLAHFRNSIKRRLGLMGAGNR
jgi:hypothetical protein